jgi:predicted AlkP superfamily pyrophosphatase or phosphodiesterase
MKITLLAILSILIWKTAYADPVSLDCSYNLGSDVIPFSVKFDENTNKITHTREDGSVFNAVGFFSANEMSYQRIIIGQGIKVIQTYIINRTNLSVQSQISAGAVRFPDQIPMEVIGVNSGACSVVTVD